MERIRLIVILWVFLFLYGCSHVDEADRLIEVEQASVSRAVLIEDFTGQRCINCPEAAEEIARMQQQYGEENVIAVSIHSGPLAVYPGGQVVGLRTELGDTYYNYWKVEAEPSGLINRRGGVVLQNQWQALVYQELQRPALVSLDVTCELTSSDIVDITVSGQVAEHVKGKLQVWLTEDQIVAPQMMPDGTMKTNYLHRHVLRTSVNGTWGDDVDWNAGERDVCKYSLQLDPEWNTDHLSIVAFVYNDEGVMQVKSEKVRR